MAKSTGASGIVLFLFLCTSSFFVTMGIIGTKTKSSITKDAYGATGLLFMSIPAFTSPQGNVPASVSPICTVFNIVKKDGGYEAATAAHCTEIGDSIPVEVTYSVSYENPVVVQGPIGEWGEGTTTYETVTKAPATVLAAGSSKDIDDVAVLFVRTDEKLPVLDLGDSNDVKAREEVIIPSIPGDQYGKEIFTGYVSSGRILTSIQHLNGLVTIIAPGLSKGSSGSAVISLDQKAVVGVVVREDRDEFMATPVNVLKHFIEDRATRDLNF